MNKLQELYAKRKVFEDYNCEVPVDLRNEISWEEHLLYEKAIDTIASFIPTEIERVAVNRVLFIAEYLNGKLTRIGSGNIEISDDDLFGSYKVINQEDDPDIVSDSVDTDYIEDSDNKEGVVANIDSDEEQGDANNEDSENGEEESNDEDNNSEGIRRKSKSIGFTVKFEDGKVIKYKTARRTMIEALKYMGLDRASKYQGETFKGYSLVGKDKRLTDQKHLWQVQVDGWWIYVNMGNSRAISCIKGVADMLNIPLEIIRDDEVAVLPLIERDSKEIGDAKGKRAKYSLNGGVPTWKNRTVLNTVCKLLKELPNATFRDICEFFPKSLQGSYGVVATISDIEERCKQNKSENRRWFLDPSDILTLADGTKFTVTTEWGDNFENFRKHVIREFGWTIEEVK